MIPQSITRVQLEQELHAIARAVLHKGALQSKQSLFEQGLTSVGALEIRGRLESRFQIRLQSSVLFDYPTLAAFAAFLLERLQSESARPAAVRPPDGPLMGDALVREILKKEFGV
ncbi:acyl carrier protein [Chromobacterium vaccinii]|uniref:acyl carrier protein n=1 Tax=Chromobacterium vaccinii TaxID=1108595 RepID=UPI003C77959C